jgi:hypothetical protein
VRSGDNPAFRRLPEHLGEASDRDGAGGDDVGQDLTRSDGGKLVDVADDQQSGVIGNGPEQRLH